MNLGTILYTTILYPLEQLIELSFFLFDKIFDNVGIATLGVSLTVTLLCLPLYIVAEGWEDTERNIQAKMKPTVDRIKSVFKGDEQYMILTTYYRQNHYHPMMALRSSFGILIQIPFFMAAYHCLSHMEALRGTSFAFIRDMGKPDAVFTIGSFNVNILPIAMTLINCISGTIYSKGHAIREKIQIYGMACLFLVVLYDSPAGLVLYWTMNNVFSMIKNIFYKMKNPLKVLYLCMVGLMAFMAFYILFMYGGVASMKKRLMAAVPILCLIPIPLYLKAIDWLLANPFSSLVHSRKARLSLFALSSTALTLFMGLILPSTMISTSVQEFSNIDSFGNPTAFLHFSFWQVFGICIFWSGCIFFLFKEKIQTLMAVLFSTAFICALVNSYVFAGNYGSMDVTLKFLDGMQKQGPAFMPLNAIAVIAVFILVAAVLKFNRAKILSTLSLIACIAFVAVSIINSTRITRDYREYEEILASGKFDAGQKTKYSLSRTGKNVAVLMLDRLESSFFLDTLNDRPELKDSYDGFTFYPNTVSFNGHTLMGSPAVYGGYEYSPYETNKRNDVQLKDKHNEALLLMPRLLTENAGFTATLTDTSWGNYSYVADMSFVDKFGSDKIRGFSLSGHYSGDYKQETKKGSDVLLSNGLKRNLLWVSLFRCAPAILRAPIYYKGSWLNTKAIDGNDGFIDWYSSLYYLSSLTDLDSTSNSFLMITNEASHFSGSTRGLGIVDQDRLSIPGTDNYANSVAVHIAVASWLDWLKKNNVYDNTRIIIVADHGIGDDFADYRYGDSPRIDGYQKDHFNPILLVKDFGSTGELTVDHRFMTNADTPILAVSGLVENPVNPWTGNPLDESYKNDGVVVANEDIIMPYQSKSTTQFTVKDENWWTVRDDIFQAGNWKRLNEK
ncbi:MAG: YidC/Oxa1 family membrane protein insertase [Treponema sp.]|nr:YidC/Oxa1 family membrane protein insertase [Treponema sp.]